MTKEIANALLGYFEVLCDSNKKLLLLCGSDCFNDENTNVVLDIIQNIPRLIPYKFLKNTEENIIANRDGLIEYDKEIGFLEKEYGAILKENYCFLDKVRKIRNKHEHKMHALKSTAVGSGSIILFEFSFLVTDNNGEDEEIYVNAGDFIRLFKQLNELFSKLQKEIEIYAEKNQKTEYAYYKGIARFDFCDFNKLYDSFGRRTVEKIE